MTIGAQGTIETGGEGGVGAIVPKIFLGNGTITAQIDLKELLHGRPGDDEAEWILENPKF